jgi:hypothetical protein
MGKQPLVQIQLNHAELITCKTRNCCIKSILCFPAPGRLAPVVCYSESPKEMSSQTGPMDMKVGHIDSCLPEITIWEEKKKRTKFLNMLRYTDNLE